MAAVAAAVAATAAMESPASLVLAAAASAAAAAADSAAAIASAASFQPNPQPEDIHAAIAIATLPLWETTTRAIADAVAQAASLDATLSSPSRAQPASRLGAVEGAGPLCSFELVGIDVLPDEAGNMWILEIQRHPSLLPSSPFDQRVKAGAVEAVHALLGAGTKDAITEIAGSHITPLPPSWTLCSPTPPVAGGESHGETPPVPMDKAEIAGWQARADAVALEVAADLYAGECARRELFF